ncbi:uncharacterized protein SCHCODRAFT_02602246 [Schizophyllum commune H4-8]|uniref:Uncharacterized protein n=1 Tax=Schizophyllum commune (strain H4-8 / FGSC 9210) TaxID=578458 RepID=D8QF19_SCHCM|nr:uncharacterized protein SCHCODRAFT_02602246 [Schizophyllum commune H4-8]KAI5887447.1 hypothetical protein SCHCODRAFT_02602246 [Schizophyllum commune H4-8]
MDHFTILPTALATESHPIVIDEEPLAVFELDHPELGAGVPVNEEHHGSCHTQNQYVWERRSKRECGSQGSQKGQENDLRAMRERKTRGNSITDVLSMQIYQLREHWQDGHKDECATFIHPPFAKTFDPTDRADAPWPLHPIFASTNENGLGIWMTTAGDLTSMLQQASIPPDVRAADVPPEGSPSFRRWAGLEGPNRRNFGEEMNKYVGPTVATLRVLVQNRRTDGRVIAVVGGETVLSVSSIMKDNLLPEEQSRVRFQPLEGRMDLMLVPPWIDYDKRLRVAIAEINGAILPKGKFGSDGEYQAPSLPMTHSWQWASGDPSGLISLVPRSPSSRPYAWLLVNLWEFSNPETLVVGYGLPLPSARRGLTSPRLAGHSSWSHPPSLTDAATHRVIPSPTGLELMLAVVVWLSGDHGCLDVSLVSATVSTRPLPAGPLTAPVRPTGSPWDRVVSWERAQIVLAPGDFAVYLVQYRIGDGHLYNSYPEIMTRATGVCVPCYLTRAKGTDSGWCASAAGELRIARNLLMLPNDLFTPIATMDFAYVEEYYKPFFDEGPDVFAVKRFGKRAEQMNSLMSTLGPLQMQAMMSVLPPDQREEVKRRSKAMGFDMDRMMRG